MSSMVITHFFVLSLLLFSSLLSLSSVLEAELCCTTLTVSFMPCYGVSKDFSRRLDNRRSTVLETSFEGQSSSLARQRSSENLCPHSSPIRSAVESESYATSLLNQWRRLRSRALSSADSFALLPRSKHQHQAAGGPVLGRNRSCRPRQVSFNTLPIRCLAEDVADLFFLPLGLFVILLSGCRWSFPNRGRKISSA